MLSMELYDQSRKDYYRQGARSNIAQISLRQMKYALSWKSFARSIQSCQRHILLGARGVCETVIHLSVRRVRLAWTHIFEGCSCCIVRLRGCNSPVSGNIARLFVVKAPLPEAYVTFIAGVTLLDHLLWKHRSSESCVQLSTFQVDVLYVWL